MIKMLSEQEILDELSEHLNIWRDQYGIKKIALFGSYVREEQTPSSDIDLLVEFDQDAITFDNYMNLKFSLEDLFEKKLT